MLSMGNVLDASRERGACIGMSQGKILVGHPTHKKEGTKKKSELGREEVRKGKRGTSIGVCGKEEGKCPCCVVMDVW
jgi:hypothetical protein